MYKILRCYVHEFEEKLNALCANKMQKYRLLSFQVMDADLSSLPEVIAVLIEAQAGGHGGY